jgi:uncharacterized protein (TIGR03435 family)
MATDRSSGELYILRALASLLILSGGAMAQNDGRPEFEVASIKPAAPDARGRFIRTTPGRVNVTNMTLKDLMVLAWRIQPFQISGGPAWLDTARYDISAKPENAPNQGELPLMIQNLLADRFQLKLHTEIRELPVYALVIAKKDGALGPSLTEAKEDSCTPTDPSKPVPPPGPGKLPALGCGGLIMQPRLMRGVSVQLASLTMMLSRLLGRTVVDKTGLTGKFDISMEWTPDETQLMLLPSDAPQPPPSDVPGPSIFAALQEQLGLKLESQRGPVEVLMIDRAEKPSEN